MTPHIPEDDIPVPRGEIDCASCCDRLHELALGILPTTTARSVADHLGRCDTCRAEYAGIHAITRLLPYVSAPATPSPGVKAGLLARLDEPEPARGNPRTFTNPWAPSKNKASVERPAQETTTVSVWQRWVLPGIIAPLAICLLVLVAWTNSLHNQVNTLREPDNAPEVAFAALQDESPYDLQLYEFRPACENCPDNQAAGQLGGNPRGNVGVVVAWNLDPNEKHQVWCVNHQGEKQLITDLQVEFEGNVFQTVSFPEPIGGYQQIYVARHDGSPEPDAELLVAMNESPQQDDPESTPRDMTAG